MSDERSLLISRRLKSPGLDRWLAIDLTGGDQIFELPGRESLPDHHPGGILVSPELLECAGLPEAGLLVPEGVLWSFLDPMHAKLPVSTEFYDRVELEMDLRRLAQRFRRRVAWWQHLPGALKESCRDKLRGFHPDLGSFLDQLNRTPVILSDSDRVSEDENPPDSLPHEMAVPGTPEEIYTWFTSDEGLGSTYGSHFQPRREQAEMAREVARNLNQHDALMVEAGTGVGKTLAYLVPLIARVVSHGERAVVSTHTRALQSQILEQDLPRLQGLLGSRKFALLMGRRNYLCLRQRLSYNSRPLGNLLDGLQAAAFRLWLHETTSGMREELTGHPLLAAEVDSLFDAADLCLPGQCYEGGKCFVQKARKTARESDVLVINHSLLMHDMLADNTLIGEVDQVVVDEAHRLPAVVLDTHGIAVGLWRLDEIEDLLGKVRGKSASFQRVGLVATRLEVMGKEGQRAASAAVDFGDATRRMFKNYKKWWQALGVRVDAELPGSAGRIGKVRVRDKDEAFGEIRPQTVALLESLSEASEAFATLARRTGQLDDLTSGMEDDLAQLAQAGQLLRRLYFEVKKLTSAPDEEWVTWIEPGKHQGVRRLGASLLEAGDVLREHWLGSGRAPVMTSATLAVGEDFTHMMGELGLTRRRPPAVTFASPSPFDYHRQMKILAPARFPAPNAPDFGRAVGQVMAEMGLRIPRKTMGLFTSYRMIREVGQVMEEAGLDISPAAGKVKGVPVFSQLPGTSAAHVLERFRQADQAVLLGTNTFWEGVDFPGQDLEILVVTKLPFLVPNDPWVEARCEKVAACGENPFTSFMVRDAVLRLRQGIGRLIRRVSDKGVVLLLDNRLHTKNYGVTFLEALPVVPETFSDSGDLLDRLDGFFKQT